MRYAVYRVSPVLNLARRLMMVGAYLLTTATQFSHWLVAIAAAVVLTWLWACWWRVLMQMTGEMVLAAVLTTVALASCCGA